MRERNHKKLLLPVILGICLMLTAACGKDAAGGKWKDGLTLEKDGHVVLSIVDTFDREYYDINELTGMVVEEVAQFNGQHRDGGEAFCVMQEVTRPEGSQDQVRVVYRFRDGQAYQAFDGKKLWYGTLETAIAGKQVLTGEILFEENKDSKQTITLDEKTKGRLSGKHAVVLEGGMILKLPYEVLYFSEGVKLLEDGSADTTECTGRVVLILKK